MVDHLKCIKATNAKPPFMTPESVGTFGPTSPSPSPQYLQPVHSSTLSNRQKGFLLDLVIGMQELPAMQNAVKTCLQGTSDCPLDPSLLRKEITSDPKFGTAKFVVLMLGGLVYFERAGYSMAARSVKAFLTEAVNKWTDNDEMSKALRQMVAWPTKHTMTELWRKVEAQRKFWARPEPISYSTKADAIAMGESKWCI
jgi:hypothetical protein